jgi:branched-chain amino acid transport system substrate-binding protein
LMVRVLVARGRWLVGLVGCVVLVGVLVPVSAGAVGRAAASGAPIVLGNVSTNTRNGQTDNSLPEALQAWASWTNAHGGVNGRPVKVITKDDNGDVSQAVAAVKELVEQDHVVALVAINDVSVVPSWADYVKEQKIPVVGGVISEVSPWADNPSFFPLGLTLINTGQALPLTAKLLGSKNFGLVLCSGLAACEQAVPLFKAGAAKVKVPMVYSALAPQVSSDYTSYCLAAKGAGAQGLTVSGIAVPTFISNCARQNYHPVYVFSPNNINNANLKGLGSEKGGAPAPVFPFFYKGPETQDFQAAMKKYADIPTANQGNLESIAWVSAEAFKQAVSLSGAKGVPTSEDVFNGMYKFNKETLGGLTTPLTFSASDTTRANNCFFVVAVKNAKYTAPNKLKPSCVPGN